MNTERNSPFTEQDALRFNNRDESQVKLLRTLLIISIVTDALALVASMVGGFGWDYFIPIGSLLVFALGSLVALNRGYLRPAQILLPSTLFAVITYIIAFPPGYGLHDINLIAYAVVITLASLTLGQRGAFVFTFLIILSVFAIGIGEMRGSIVSPTSSLTLPVSPFAISIVVLAITLIQRALINLLNESAEHARTSEKEVLERNIELQKISEGLEKLVQERTKEIESARLISDRRAKQFEAISQVSRTISSVQELDSLLSQVTTVISREFGFYHVGIFLVDNAKEYAVLSAANSEGGQVMLARGHRLKIGETGLVGYATGTGKARIALDTGTDAVFFDNPDLPNTHSEITLPLLVGEEIIGALDVQSTEVNAFSQDDIRTLSTLADQVGIAIQNARQFDETRKALRESNALSRQFAQTGWQQLTKTKKLAGVLHTGAKSSLLYTNNGRGGEQGISSTGLLRAKGRGATLSLPIKLRGEVIGSVDIRAPENRQWDEDEMDVVTAIIERAALAMENARLLEESQKLAAKERTIGDISAKISASINLKNILQTAVEELGRAMPGSDVIIELEQENEVVEQ